VIVIRNRSYCIKFLFSATLLLAGSQLLAAQMLPSQMTETPSISSSPKDKFLMLVAPRDVAEIQRDIESAEQARLAAAEAERTAQEQRAASAARSEEKKLAIAANKDKLKAAKREKKESEILLLETEKKALNRDKHLFEQREGLRNAESDLAGKRGELSILIKQAFDLERQLALKRAEQTGSDISGPDGAREARLLIDLEKASLEAQKNVADKQGEVASSAKKVIVRQLKILEAQQNIYAGK
jgi:hypothetical protein